MTSIERRIFDVTELRATRDEGQPQMIEGYAAVFGKDSLDLGGFIEQIEPGAFARSLQAAKDNPVNDMIHVFWNHDTGQPLASTRSGKLLLAEDATGLRFRFPASRMTPAQIEAVEDGDMRMSFGFITQKDEWTRGAPGAPDRRKLLDLDLLEISPVSKPAYPDTVVAARSHDSWLAEQPKPEPDGPKPADLTPLVDRVRAIDVTL